MAGYKVLCVFDYPNIVKSWARLCNKEILDKDDINWLEMRKALRDHVVARFGTDVSIEYRIFKNRWNHTSEHDRIKELRNLGYKFTIKKKDVDVNSDIDDDIAQCVETASRDHDNLIVYLVGTDLRNYLPIAAWLSDSGVPNWIAYTPSLLTRGSQDITGLPFLTWSLDLESLDGVLLRPGDRREMRYDQMRSSPLKFKPRQQGTRKKSAQRRKQEQKKAHIDTSMRGVRKRR